MHARPSRPPRLLLPWIAVLLTLALDRAAGAEEASAERRETGSPGNAVSESSSTQLSDVHPFVVVVREYRRAVAQRDTAALQRLQAPGSRIWFEKREGEGRPLDPAGKGPWAEWDRFFHARSEASDFVVEDHAVRVTNREINDWYRLVEREPAPYHIVYFLDAQSRIEGKLVQAIPGVRPPTDRLREFESWAAKKYPGLLETLQPDGRIDPALEKAQVWKEKLQEWRSETGLPALQLDEP